MTFEALTNRGEYLSAHYLTEVLPGALKKGLLSRWADEERAGRPTPRTGIRELRRTYFDLKAELVDLGNQSGNEAKRRDKLREMHHEVLCGLGFVPAPQELTVRRAGAEHTIPVAHAEPGVIAIECGWAVDTDAAIDPDSAGRLLDPVELDRRERIEHGLALATHLFAVDEQPPRYVLILAGGVLTLADRLTWGEGRYLAASLDVAFGRNDARPAGELDVIAALFGASSLRPPAEGGAEPLAELVAGSQQHAVGVSTELREGLRQSVELIANEVLDRIREAGVQPEAVMELDELGRELVTEALRYLYRILFLLYAEARPELGVLPVDHPEYAQGYSLARLGDLVARNLVGTQARGGFHLYESLDLLFRMVNDGHRPRDGQAEAEPAAADRPSEGEGIRFEPLRSDLFLPEAIKLVGRDALTLPGHDPDDPDAPKIDTRLRNATVYRVLRLLMLTRGRKKERGGFISYAQLGINQLGAVYEGLMSYTGFIAGEELYEVAKDGDPKDGSWMIPASKADDYPGEVFVHRVDDETGVRSRVRYPVGSFVYRLAGRDRQTSASYYTPQSLTEVTVQLALKYRLDQDGTTTPARELLDWTICEPALGSGAFLNEAINQVAAEYLRRRQAELGERLDPERYTVELQKAKAYIALHNCYGVDLNRTAVELAEVSLWLNVMHPGLQAPWFGLHLRRGNSLIGAGRRVYSPEALAERQWLTATPTESPFRDEKLPNGVIHHFLLPAKGWGVVAAEKEAKELAPEAANRLAAWRRMIQRAPSTKRQQGRKLTQVQRLQALTRRAEYLWDLVRRRLAISEREIRRDIAVWAADDLPRVTGAVGREKIVADLEAKGTPYWRLKTIMDAWCALWFWPLDAVALLDGSAAEYTQAGDTITRVDEQPVYEEPPGVPQTWEAEPLFDLGEPEQLSMPDAVPAPRRRVGTRKASAIEHLTRRIPLTGLDDWLDFCEAVLGRGDIPAGSLAAAFVSLAGLEQHEDQLPSWMGMEELHRLSDRFPWLATVEDIADRHGFFHWELEFAQAFAKGGFDLQVGNPPWVRPQWDESAVLAERNPWFKLSYRPPLEVWRERKAAELAGETLRSAFLAELAGNTSMVEFLASSTTYPLITGTQPDLYRGFMCRVWTNLAPTGAAGLIHPDTHFTGSHEGQLRAAAYEHLRLHGHFQNRRLIFPAVALDWNKQFGVHIYGTPRAIGFDHMCWLFDPGTLVGSINHDGTGEVPGIKYRGYWDLRPHRARLVRVDENTLAEWRRLAGETGSPVEQTRLLYPVTALEQTAISTLADWGNRLATLDPSITSGFHESGAKQAGLIRAELAEPDDWCDVILRGPQFTIATPIAKQPPRTLHTDKPVDLLSLPDGAVPATDYVRACDRDRYRAAKDRWIDRSRLADLTRSPVAVATARSELQATTGQEPEEATVNADLREIASRPYTEFYRVAWREMVPASTERSLFPALLPLGPAHVDGIRTMALPNNRLTALVAGFWAGLPLDYVLRIVGRGHLKMADARTMPAPQTNHPLASALLLRTLRLNCLTTAYADLWAQLYDLAWPKAGGWAVDWPGLAPLGAVGPVWERGTPLRAEQQRRAALVEIDALVAVWLGIGADELTALHRSRFPQLVDYEAEMWFDANGRKIAANFNQWGHRQTKEHYVQLMAHLEDPDRNPPPEGYAPPFYKADREAEMRQAHAVFSARLQAAKDAGWRP